jgi:multicomponent Na+:H+ antiporter subunit F
MINPETIYYLELALLLLVGVAGFGLIARGPTIFDRLIGFDTVVISIVGWIVLFSIRAQTAEYLELIIVITGLGFFATVSYFYYLSQPSKRTGVDKQGEDA